MGIAFVFAAWVTFTASDPNVKVLAWVVGLLALEIIHLDRKR